MKTRQIEFEILSGSGDYTTVELEVCWHYHFIPGKFFGLPENCYPDDESAEICIDDMEQIITNLNPSVAPQNITLVEKRLEELSGSLPEWEFEERQAYLEDLADKRGEI